MSIFDQRRKEIAEKREAERQQSIKESEERRRRGEYNDTPSKKATANFGSPFQQLENTKKVTSPSKLKTQIGRESLKSRLPSFSEQVENTKRYERNDEPQYKSKGLATAAAGGIGEILDRITFGGTDKFTDWFEGYTADATKSPPLDEKKTRVAKEVSGLVGELGAGAGSYRLAARATKPLVSKLPSLGEKIVSPLANRLSPQAGALTKIGANTTGKVAGEALTGVASGALYGTPRELIDELQNPDKQTLAERLKDVGIDAATGGIADPFISSLGRALKPFPNLDANTDKTKQPIIPDKVAESPVNTLKGLSAAPEQAAAIAEKGIMASNAKELQAPKEHWFTKLFGNQGVGVTPGKKTKELIDTQVVSNSREPLALMDKAREFTEKTNQDYIDRFSPFRKINEQTYDAAMDSTRANNLANIAIKDKLVDLEGNVIGNSLAEVYSTVPRGQKHVADRYLIARDAINRMDRQQQVYGKEQWFPQTSKEAEALVTKLEQQYPWLKEFGTEWNQFNRNRQDLWVQSGISSQQLIDTLRHTNPNYTPMFRQQPKLGLGRKLALNTGSAGFSGQKGPIKRAVGSGRKIIDPAQGMIETTASSYNAMMRNRAMQELYKAVQANPERYGGVMEIVEEAADAKQATLKTINDAIAENGVDGIADLLNDEMNHLWKKANQSGKTTDNIVTVMVNGEPVKMRVMDPSLLKAIDGITPNQLEGFMRIADTISRGIKQSATGLLAPLQGARLAFRDLPVALAQSNDKLHFFQDISHALVSQIGDWLPSFIPGSERLGRLAREYYRAGGGYEAYLKGDSRIRAASRDITRDPILSGRNIAKQVVKYNPMRPLKELGDAMENIPRIAAYAAEMRKSGWNKTPQNVRRALDAGREATVNWSRRGAKTQGIEAVAPYTNAAIQGTYRIAKRFKEQPISASALVASIAAAKIYAYEQFKNDPDYQQRSKFEKGIPVWKNADGKFVTIPVEPSDAYIADQVLNFYKWAKDKESMPNAKENVQAGLDSFLPSVLSGPAAAFTTPGRMVDLKEAGVKTAGGTVLEPIIAATTGKNYFGGDIVPREYQDDPTQLQYDETSSAAAKWAAENLGIDAFTFDYIANKFGGDIAKIGLPLTSDVGKGDIEGNFIDQVNARIKLLEDPVMRNNISEDYYSRLEKVSDTKAISDRKDTPLPTWYQRAYDEVTSMKKGSLNKAISELNAMKKEITKDTTLTAKERADQLRDVQRNINMLRIQGIKRLEELGVPK
ncbi:LPD38 domain-containing protein [Paenibacillus sp. NEAU-GSW1]|uniref:LPD38 domain-containing protein n=1 Tax=Paenibacillus sp. NEAU-GSW1 TaxID=2682486 RepID=UPI0012E320E1|nr:LPD38 domain-containing protein [Paenibacillus sp. NEAU-GSW1]MUT66004.1 hypothetical protein [Paenibacillus sp. NEAU-GSW1]